MRYHDTC